MSADDKKSMKNYPACKELKLQHFTLKFLDICMSGVNLDWTAPSGLEQSSNYIYWSYVNDLSKNFECKIVIIFLPISFNICFGCSRELSQ